MRVEGRVERNRKAERGMRADIWIRVEREKDDGERGKKVE